GAPTGRGGARARHPLGPAPLLHTRRPRPPRHDRPGRAGPSHGGRAGPALRRGLRTTAWPGPLGDRGAAGGDRSARRARPPAAAGGQLAVVVLWTAGRPFRADPRPDPRPRHGRGRDRSRPPRRSPVRARRGGAVTARGPVPPLADPRREHDAYRVRE